VRSSEQIDDNQLMLMLEGEGAAKKPEASSADRSALDAEIKRQEQAAKLAKTRKQRDARVPEHLPAVDEVIEPEEVAAEPEAWRLIGEEVTVQLDYERARFFRRRIIRKKYVLRDEPHKAPIIAPLNTLQERCIAAPGLIAQIIVAKYCDHLPLYRQEQIYASRHQIAIPRQSMARWLGLAADWLKPIYEQINSGVMAGGYVKIDETPIEYLSPGNGQTKQGYLWACKRPGADVSFTRATSRAARCLDRIIPADFSGTVQCDGYSAYPSFAKQSEGGNGARLEPQPVADIVETQRMGEQDEDHRAEVAEHAVAAGFDIDTRLPGCLVDDAARNELEHLPEKIEVVTCWLGGGSVC
jgi:transposase